MGPLGVPELIFILVLALLIFGPKRLPEIGRTIGKGMAEFRKASTELTRSINTELALDETPAPPQARAWEAPAQTAARSPLPAPPSAEPAPEQAVPDPVPDPVPDKTNEPVEPG